MQKKYLAVLLAAAMGATVLTGCGRKPEPTTDEAMLLLMEREILRRDKELPPEFIQYHIEHGLPVEKEETDGVRTILKEVGRYLPDEVNDYLSQADKIVQDVGDVTSQAQGLLDQLDSGAGKDLVDQFTSGSGKDLVDQFTSGDGREIIDQITSGEGREIIDQITSGAGGEIIDGLLGGNTPTGENLCKDPDSWDFWCAEDAAAAGEAVEGGVRLNVEQANSCTEGAAIDYDLPQLEAGASYHIEFDYAATCDLHWTVRVGETDPDGVSCLSDDLNSLSGIVQHYSGDFTAAEAETALVVLFGCSDAEAAAPYSCIIQNLSVTKR